MPIVQIQLLEGRSTETKQEIIYKVTETLAKTAGVPKERIRVIIQEIPLENWGINGETMATKITNKGETK